MKVLRQPPTAESWSIKVYCTRYGHSLNGCGARLKVYREDLRQNKVGTDVMVTFKCICCGQLTNIGFDFYPPNYHDLKPYKLSWT